MSSQLEIDISYEKGKWGHCYDVRAILNGQKIGEACGYSRSDSSFHLSYIKVVSEHTRKGVGTRLMETLCDLADEKGWVVTLTPSPQDTRVMSMRALRAFYASFGFRRWRYGDMVRFPEVAVPLNLKTFANYE